MNKEKKEYVKVQQIDGMTGIQTPHARELKTLGERKVPLFINNKYRQIKIFVENKLNGKIENINFNENYTVTFEYFPEVRAHILFFNYEEENEVFGESELKFLFSGKRVLWVPSEDLASLLDLSLDYLEDLLDAEKVIYELPNKKTELLENSIKQRIEPFNYLKAEHLNDLATFIDGKIETKNNIWILSKNYFPDIEIVLIYDIKTKNLDIKFKGDSITKINNYGRDQLGIFLMNHCLRFISIKYPQLEMPKIVKQCFSFSYIKSHF